METAGGTEKVRDHIMREITLGEIMGAIYEAPKEGRIPTA